MKSNLIEFGKGEALKNNNKKFEFEIGTKFKVDGISYECIKDESKSICGNCGFFDSPYCDIFICTPDIRTDKEIVCFKII